MKLTFKKLALLSLSLIAMFVLVGCTDKTTTSGSTTTIGLTDTQKVQTVLDGISLGNISAVTEDLTLPMASVNGVSLSWSTADADIVTALGEITIPSFTDGDKTVKLTLTATLNTVSLTKEFNVTVKAETAEQFLTRIANAIIINGSDSIIASFTLPSTLQGATITWTSSNSDYAEIAATVDNAGLYKVTINRPIIEDDGVNTSIVLTGTMTIGETVKTITKDIRVLAMNRVVYMTIDEASKVADDGAVMFKGIITAILGGSAFVQDETGGIYLYNVGSANLPKLVVGNEVEVVGKIDIYGGFVEVIGLSKLEVLSTGNDLPDALDFDYVDIEELTSLQGDIVNMTQLKLKSLITTTTVGTSLYFFLTDGVNEVEMKVDKYTDDTIEAAIHTLLKSLTLADTFKLVNVPIALYEGEAQFYLTNISQLVKLTDAEKLAADKQMLTIGLTNVSDGKQTLPLVGLGGSTIAWAVSPTTATINATTGEITFPTLTEQTTFTLTATITKGALTAETKVFEVVVSPMTAQAKFDADLAAVTVALTAKELDDVTLPVLGTFGSTIAWEVTSGTATIATAGNKISYPFIEAAQTVVVTATVKLGELEQTKSFTVEVAALDLLTIAEFKALPDNTVGAMKVILTGNTANHQWWLQDSTGGINMYISSSWRTEFSLIPWGSEIVIIGPQKINYGQPQVNGISKYYVTSTAPEMPTPVNLDEEEFTNENLLPLMGQLVSFSGFTVKTVPVADSYGTYTFTLEDVATSRTINVRLDNRVIPVALYNATKAQLLTLQLNDKVDVVAAYMSSYSSSYELAISLASHIVLHVASAVEIAAADVAAVTIDATYDAGEVVTLPSTSNTSTIVWSVELAEVNASITNNAVTFANVTETTIVTLKATFTYGTGETAIVTNKEFEVSIIVLTPAQKLAADKAALTVALTATEFATVTLPTTTTYGTVVTWALTETVNASLATNVLTLNYLGSEYSVVVTATLTLAGDPVLTDTKEFTIVVSPVAVVTEFSVFNQKTGTEWTFAGTEMMYVKGIVSAKNGTAGFFLQDASGDGIYAHGAHTVNVGDEVIIYTKLGVYNSVRQLNTWSVKKVLSSGNTPLVTTMTTAELAAITSTSIENASKLINVTGLEIKEFKASGYISLIWTTIEGETPVVYTLEFNYNNSTYLWLKDVYAVGDFLPAFDFVLYNIYNTTTFNILPQSGLAITDQQSVDLNKALLPASLELTENYTIPTSKYSASITITAISTELTSYLTTAGVVTLPETDAVGTITFTVSKGTVTETVTIPVTVKALTDAQKLALAVAEIPSTIVLGNDFTLPTALFSATYESVEIVAGLQDNLEYVSGDLVVARPASGLANVTGTVTVTLKLGTDTLEKVINVTVKAYATDLFISYYMEGDGGNKKILAAHNDTGADIDLANYKLGFFGNPTAAPVAASLTGPVLSGTLAQGKTLIIHHADMLTVGNASYFEPLVTALSTLPSGNIVVTNALSFNGEKSDIIALTKKVGEVWTFIDVLGVYDGPVATGSAPWETSYTKNKTLVRSNLITSPTTTTNWEEWVVGTQNSFDSKLIGWY